MEVTCLLPGKAIAHGAGTDGERNGEPRLQLLFTGNIGLKGAEVSQVGERREAYVCRDAMTAQQACTDFFGQGLTQFVVERFRLLLVGPDLEALRSWHPGSRDYRAWSLRTPLRFASPSLLCGAVCLRDPVQKIAAFYGIHRRYTIAKPGLAPGNGLPLAEGITQITAVVKLVRGSVVHPDAFLPNIRMRLGHKRYLPPSLERFVVEGTVVSGDHHIARHPAQREQQLLVLGLVILEPVNLGATPRLSKIRRISIDELGTVVVETA
ncbi:hypothetical protein WR25_15556 [Diploscapter pachys]|uniref:Uncharacterized protein n=1 Tax=Diploscapter pachys TaxID=2018661 RepID=A0A2A2JWD6_9BILA|nr:hypothetical protein WR25_15556 [Diploscapter pachys]